MSKEIKMHGKKSLIQYSFVTRSGGSAAMVVVVMGGGQTASNAQRDLDNLKRDNQKKHTYSCSAEAVALT